MANPKWTPRTGGYETVIWAGKIAFYFLAILSLGAIARAVAAPASSALSSFLPRASLRSWIAPPYLFAAVHFIILAIWKLSGQKRPQSEWATEETTKQPGNPTMLGPFGASPPPIHLHSREPSHEVRGDEVPAADHGDSSEPSLTGESVDVPADSSEIGAEETDDEPMEVEWKEETDELPPPPATQDELNRRFEDFIKKNHEQIRLPSNQPPAD